MKTTNYESFTNLYPMPMNSIEKFHWFDDNPEYPNFVFCRIRIAGKLDQQVARDAWQITIQRQPIGDVEPKNINGKWIWVQGPRAQGNENFESWNGTRFEWQEFDAEPRQWRLAEHKTQSPTGSYLGIASWPISSSETQSDESTFVTEIWLYVHHAIGDGAGSIACINDWMLVYANLMSNRDAEAKLHQLDGELLRQRNNLGLTKWRYLKHLWKQPIALFGASKFVFRKTQQLLPSRVKASRDNALRDVAFPSIIGSWLSESTVQKIESHAKEFNVRTNSVLLGRLYLALAGWRSKESVHSDSDWIRIILPMSIRNVSDRRMPTANRATIVQVDRRSKDAADLGKFYQGIDYEIAVIRGWQLDKMFLIVVRLLSSFDWLLKRSARTEKSRGMALFTNLADPLRRSERAGAKEPESTNVIRPTEFDFVGPIRKGTPANFSASRYGKRMRISLQFDSTLLTQNQADELLAGYIARLEAISA